MEFNTLFFIYFFSGFSLLYYFLPRRAQPWILAAGSCFFYCFFSPASLFILLLVILLIYKGGHLLEVNSGPRQKIIIGGLVSVIILLLILSRFLALVPIGFEWDSKNITGYQGLTMSWLVPVGLSYLSFSGISYLVDIKRKKIQASRHYLPFFSFFLYFPKITQGPIERPAAMIAHFDRIHLPDYTRIANGLKLVAWGFFKKLVIADRLAVITATVFSSPQDYPGIALLIATLAFTFQIYADFSGYTDIAIGISGILGIDLSQNFNRPYFSRSIRDFWTRWHMTLSNWLRDYLFLPLAYWLSRKMKKEKYLLVKSEKWIYLFSTMITFSLCGLWHGIGWTYLFWGMLFGVYLSAEMFLAGFRKRTYRKLHINRNGLFPIVFHTCISFILVTMAWVFFRAENLQDAWFILSSFVNIPHEVTWSFPDPGYLKSMLSGLGVTQTELITDIFLVLFLLTFEMIQKNRSFTGQLNVFPAVIRWSFYYALLTMILFLGAFNSNQNFIYAQF